MHEHASAAIMSIGDELTLGQKLDSNSRWLADQLTGLGILTAEHATVPDDHAAITDCLKRLMARSDLVLVTGGLGPTADDLTRQGLAGALERPLEEDAGALAQIEAYFAGRNRVMPEINRVQAMRPEGATVLPNTAGTAPGLHAWSAANACDVFCMPGPPREMTPMFESCVRPMLNPPRHRCVRTLVLHCAGLGESQVAMKLGPLMDRTRVPTVGTTASQAVVSCRIRYEGPIAGIDGASPEDLVARTAALVRDRLAEFIFGEGEQTLESTVIDLLRQQRRTLAVVESCTAGLLGEMVADIAGASDVFMGGWITYSNEQKQMAVGVPAGLFESGAPGAVSGECALAMARGGLERSSAGVCMAITGIAGPGGGSKDKPVGTVWIALADRDGPSQARRFLFAGGRRTIREWSARTALAMLRLHLIGRGDLPLLGEQR
jgi:nicotinamide-nucleotide amidase